MGRVDLRMLPPARILHTRTGSFGSAMSATSAEEMAARTAVPQEAETAAQTMFFNIAADNLSGDISEDEFARLWTLGVGSERTLGRPQQWNGEERNYDEFAFRFLNWLGGCRVMPAITSTTPASLAPRSPSLPCSQGRR